MYLGKSIVHQANVSSLHRVHNRSVLSQSVLKQKLLLGHLPHQHFHSDEIHEDEFSISEGAWVAVSVREGKVFVGEGEVGVQQRFSTDVVLISDALEFS